MPHSTHILICDDDPVVHESLGLYLDAEQIHHASAYDGEEVLRLAKLEEPDLILLDLMMPGRSGMELCRELRSQSNIPIIILSARGEEVDRILGLELGADDYIVKPFSPREVIARIKAVLRRKNENSSSSGHIIRFPKLEINRDRYQVRVADELISCTPKEVELLFLLASHPGVVMSREQILQQVWGYDYLGDMRTVDTHIRRLRQKLEIQDAPWVLQTVYSVGYKFEVFD